MFKPGDRVRCINDDENKPTIESGRIYCVAKIVPVPNNRTIVYLKDTYGGWFSDRFVLETPKHYSELTCAEISKYLMGMPDGEL